MREGGFFNLEKTMVSVLLCAYIVRLLFACLDSCGVRSKAYLDKLNRRAACIVEGQPLDGPAYKQAEIISIVP